MSIAVELKKIYDEVDRARLTACFSCGGCADCPYYTFGGCIFENIKADIRHLTKAVDRHRYEEVKG